MLQRTSPSNKPNQIFAVRDFPHGCGTQPVKNQRSEYCSEVVAVTSEKRHGYEHRCVGVADQNYHKKPAYPADRSKKVESFDVIMKKAGFNLAPNGNVGKGRFVSGKRKFPPYCGSKVKPLSSDETMRLIASQSKRKQLSDSPTNNIPRKPLLAKAAQNQRNYPEMKKRFSNAILLKAKAHKQTQNRDERRPKQLEHIPVMQQNHITKVLSPRDKVLRALRRFRMVFEELDRDKAARRGESKTCTSRIDCDTLTILKRERMQVNTEKIIGPVPGIEVGDEFQYKSELNLIGLHFDIMGGIDYMNIGDMKLATSIVSSEGNGYIDRFNSDVMIYSGQGGNVKSKDKKVIEDQKLVTGNLALANSMKEKTPVRVIRGRKRLDQRGKRYVYVGLYLVEDYWRERGPGGNVLFKFKLRRASDQLSDDLDISVRD
ncbi:hypothetical protein EUTSA_v10000892mg [Eutrema salsugineum]|uniref:YDG domain-containing protein n=1 Tax=Eutrema salsugineum TaxID=72664 RepID=V4N3K3_EUTSA|nr:YDG domain-containing protein At5g47160 [Eutrema salsugineum]ESQ39866.1 hypothetical protein EUTSA_v10000892mg [Eutrema salsugineum]